MPLFTAAEYADIHFVYGYCNGNARQAAAEYQRRYPNRRQPSRVVFSNVHRTLRETGAFPRHANEGGRRANARAQEQVLEAVGAEPSTSTRRIGRRLRLSQNFVWRTLHADRLHPFHLQRVQALQAGDPEQRVRYCEWMIASSANDQHFVRNVLWTDESTFGRDGINNLHNQHVWAHENPHSTRQRGFQQRFSINVWGGILNNNLFLHIIDGNLNTIMYTDFLENTLPLLLEDVPLNVRLTMWYQHDGAPAHFGRQARRWLDRHYRQQWIGRGGPVAWPPRSPDLTLLISSCGEQCNRLCTVQKYRLERYYWKEF